MRYDFWVTGLQGYKAKHRTKMRFCVNWMLIHNKLIQLNWSIIPCMTSNVCFHVVFASDPTTAYWTWILLYTRMHHLMASICRWICETSRTFVTLQEKCSKNFFSGWSVFKIYKPRWTRLQFLDFIYKWLPKSLKVNLVSKAFFL